jgi:energy-coupling factor transporter transmembrane protein EcfT
LHQREFLGYIDGQYFEIAPYFPAIILSFLLSGFYKLFFSLFLFIAKINKKNSWSSFRVSTPRVLITPHTQNHYNLNFAKWDRTHQTIFELALFYLLSENLDYWGSLLYPYCQGIITIVPPKARKIVIKAILISKSLDESGMRNVT